MMLKNCLPGQWTILLQLSLIWFSELCWWDDSMVLSECRFLWAMWIHGRFGHKVHQVSRSFDKFDMLHIGYVLAMFAPCHLGSWDIIMVLKPFLALNPLYLDASMKNDPSKREMKNIGRKLDGVRLISEINDCMKWVFYCFFLPVVSIDYGGPILISWLFGCLLSQEWILHLALSDLCPYAN